MSNQPYVNVIPAPDGQPGWRVHVEYTLSTPTQEAAITAARHIADQLGTDVTIHGEDGKIRDKDSYGEDPPEIRG